MRNLQTHCKRGHEFTEENTYVYKGTRSCRICRNAASVKSAKNDPNRLEKMRKHRAKWREAHPTYHKERELQLHYGLTLEQYNQMLAEQDNRCAICTGTMERPCVDHDHLTGKVRRILCSTCNVVLGLVNEDPAWLGRMIEYLQAFEEQ